MSLLQVSGLSKSFGGNRAVDGVSFELAAGELLALIGPNGAGKSTTFNMVGGQLRADAGRVRLDGCELIGRKPRAIWKLGVGRTFQIAETFASLTVIENVQLALLSADRRVYTLWRRATDHRREHALALLEQVGMAAAADRPASVLAYGDVKRVELAIAIAHDPKLLLMDEPFGSLDPLTRRDLQLALRNIQRDTGKTIIFVTHDMDETLLLADRIGVMDHGRLIQYGTPLEIIEKPTSAFVRDFVSGGPGDMRTLMVRQVSDIMREGHAGSAPSIAADASLRDALALMLTSHVENLNVTDGKSHITVRDILA